MKQSRDVTIARPGPGGTIVRKAGLLSTFSCVDPVDLRAAFRFETSPAANLVYRKGELRDRKFVWRLSWVSLGYGGKTR